MTPDKIDYRPLAAMNNAWKAVMRTALHGWCWPLTVVAAIIGVLVSLAIKDIRGMFVIAIYFSYIGVLVKKYKNQLWDRFAAANGWALDNLTSVESTMPASLNFGHSHHFSPIIKVQLSNTACDLFAYDCTTGYGRYSQTHYFTVAIAQLPKAVPHIMLTTVKATDVDMKNDIANAETLKLEGDFSKYFALQVEKGQEIDVLTIITPDVMQTLVDYGQGEDIEMLGDQLYFIVRGDERDPEHVKQLIQSVAELSEQLKQNISLSMPAPRPQTVVPDTPPAATPSIVPPAPPAAVPPAPTATPPAPPAPSVPPAQ